MIKTSRKPLKVLVDQLVTLGPVVDLLSQLLEVPSARFSVGGVERCQETRRNYEEKEGKILKILDGGFLGLVQALIPYKILS